MKKANQVLMLITQCKRRKRRQKLHENQNNVGNPQNKPEFKDFNGNEVK